MSLKNSHKHYGLLTKFFHWGIATLVLLQYVWIYLRAYVYPSGSPIGTGYLVNYHKPLGVVILVLVALAIIWHCLNVKPGYPNSMSRWEKILAKLTQWLLYIIVFLMSISGIVMSMASGRTIQFFKTYELPLLIGSNKEIASICHEMHEYGAWILAVIILLHVIAALKHHFINKDNILKRMTFFSH